MYTEDIISTAANIGFMQDPKFVEAYAKCLEADGGRLVPDGYSIRWRIQTLIWAAKYASKLQGDFVDFGGGFGLFSSAIYNYLEFGSINKTYYLLDSFQGLQDSNLLPIETRALDNYKRFGNYHEEVKEKFKEHTNMTIIPGYVPETLSKLNVSKACFVSVDFNCVEPEREALKFIWDKVVKGGIIIFDDYGFPGHEAQKLSHDEFAQSKDCLIYTCPTGQGILIKS